MQKQKKVKQKIEHVIVKKRDWIDFIIYFTVTEMILTMISVVIIIMINVVWLGDQSYQENLDFNYGLFVGISIPIFFISLFIATRSSDSEDVVEHRIR